MGLPHITAAELKILKVLWKLGAGTVRDVRDALAEAEPDDPPAYTTVMTLMTQLASKNALRVERSRQPFFYEPVVKRQQVLGDRLRQFLDTVFDGRAGELVQHLVDEAELSTEDIRRIENKIAAQEKKSARPESGRNSPQGPEERP